jgi:hypothetical protein
MYLSYVRMAESFLRSHTFGRVKLQTPARTLQALNHGFMCTSMSKTGIHATANTHASTACPNCLSNWNHLKFGSVSSAYMSITAMDQLDLSNK